MEVIYWRSWIRWEEKSDGKQGRTWDQRDEIFSEWESLTMLVGWEEASLKDVWYIKGGIDNGRYQVREK